MPSISSEVASHLDKLSNDHGVISALAIDQRGSLKKMIAAASGHDASQKEIEDFKVAVSEELTPYASAILLDPEYGLPAAKVRDKDAGLLIAYEETGYDATEPGRMPDLLPNWSARRLKEEGADAVKFLLYYDIDEGDEINDKKHAFVERVGAEAKEAGLPFFLELVSYDANIDDAGSAEYAKVKPHKVIDMMKIFSKPEYNVTVLKMEVPFNVKYVEGMGDGEVIWTKDEAKKLYQEQSAATDLPYIFLSAGVPAPVFIDEIKLATEAGAQFNGVLCGRATWKPGIQPFAGESEKAGREWLGTQGKANIEALNAVLGGAKDWHEKLSVK